MEKKLTWLAISLFYEKKGWHSLVQDALKLFMLSEEYTSNAILYTLAFNRERGDNIRLNIWTAISGADELLLKCQTHFESYFHHNPIERQEENWLPGDHFFLPFPVNSIQYGVYKTPKVWADNVEERYKFDMRLSNCLLEAIDEPVTTDSLLVVAILLLFSVIYAMKMITQCVKPLDEFGYLHFNKLKGRRIYSEEPEIRNIFEQIYQTNKFLFVTIMDQLFSGKDGCKELPDWVERWRSDCVEDIGKRLDRGIPCYRIYFEISNLIGQQLGYDDKFENLIHFVIGRTLKISQ